MQQKTGISGTVRSPAGFSGTQTDGTSMTNVGSTIDVTNVAAIKVRGASTTANKKMDELSAWLSKYEPIEREIIKAHERRLANHARRRVAKARTFGDLCEATGGLATVWRRDGWTVHDMVRWADGDAFTLFTLSRWLSSGMSKYIDRAQSRLRRPLYYAHEKARRQALADERRRVGGRRTTSPCPTREDILDAWTRRRESHEAAVRVGSMIHDLGCYVDNSLLRGETGEIVGRRGGVKAWLQENIPALYLRYTTVMRYKAMAKKLRQVVGLADPTPAVAVLADDTSDVAVERARAVWLEVVKGVRGSPTALMERLDALTDPDRVEEANMLADWKAKYENEITASMKSKWWRKLARKRDVG